MVPERGEKYHGDHRRCYIDLQYAVNLPGAFISIQLVCCGMALMLAIATSMIWKVRMGHGFFTFITFVASLSCVCWLVTHVFRLYTLVKRPFNWNVLGLLHNGIFGFLVMVASCIVIEVASSAEPIRAAGVFGFLGYTGFLAGLVWEVMTWHRNHNKPASLVTTTTAIPDPEDPGNRDRGSECTGVIQSVGDREVTEVIKQPPTRKEKSQNGDLTTPMLNSVGQKETDKDDRSNARNTIISELSDSSSLQEEEAPQKPS